jgi:hypothetical protein
VKEIEDLFPVLWFGARLHGWCHSTRDLKPAGPGDCW